MIQRQHLLAFGKPGTAKTAVCDRAFEGIENAEKFRIELAMSILDDAIFGPYNVKKLREEGILEHNIDGMLPRADLARLGGVLDTNKDPGEFLAKNAHAWAVLDRLLFMTEVHYLDDPKDITEMVLRFQSGKVGSVTTTIKLEMIHRLSELVVFPPSLIRDQLLFIKFEIGR